ncbi:MAG TPA: ATP-binding protein [Pseudoneobacillus sp.]|nr:ATP-binding protein [Pseudoneobacillus sp.]
MENIWDIPPQKVSTDISSYTMLIYGPPKAGKTKFTFDLYGQDAIFLRTEKGTKAIPGLIGIDIGSWSDLAKAKKQLKDPRAKAKFKVVVIDTVDNLYKYLEKYVKNKYGVDNIKNANGGYGAGFAELSETLFDALNEIEKEGYALAFISHATTKTEKIPTPQGEVEIEKYIPSVPKRGLEIMTKMVDNILFAYLTIDAETKQEKRVLYTRETLNFQAGSRFSGMPGVLPVDAVQYKQAMVKAIESLGAENLKSEKEANLVETEELNFEALMGQAKELAVTLHKAGRMSEVTQTVEKIFGPGKLLKDAIPSQVESVKIAVEELQSLVEKGQETE